MVVVSVALVGEGVLEAVPVAVPVVVVVVVVAMVVVVVVEVVPAAVMVVVVAVVAAAVLVVVVAVVAVVARDPSPPQCLDCPFCPGLPRSTTPSCFQEPVHQLRQQLGLLHRLEP